MALTTEEQIQAHQEALERKYAFKEVSSKRTFGAQYGVSPRAVQLRPQKITPAPVRECVNEISKVEKDYDAGLPTHEIETNLRERWAKYNDPCWKCAWTYVQAKQAVFGMGTGLEAAEKMKINLSSETNYDYAKGVALGLTREFQKAYQTAEELRLGCGVDVSLMKTLLDSASSATSSGDYNKIGAMIQEIQEAFKSAIHSVVPRTSIVLRASSVSPRERIEMARRTKEQFRAWLREFHLTDEQLESRRYDEWRATPKPGTKFVCKVCGKDIVENSREEHYLGHLEQGHIQRDKFLYLMESSATKPAIKSFGQAIKGIPYKTTAKPTGMGAKYKDPGQTTFTEEEWWDYQDNLAKEARIQEMIKYPTGRPYEPPLGVPMWGAKMTTEEFNTWQHAVEQKIEEVRARKAGLF
jgi:rubrerythrin